MYLKFVTLLHVNRCHIISQFIEYANGELAIRLIFFVGPPIAVSIRRQRKPIVLSLLYYSSTKLTGTHWVKNEISIDNFQGYNVQTSEQNFTLHMYGKPVQLLGCITNLTLDGKHSGQYSIVLSNEFGEYSHTFQLAEGMLVLCYT